MIRDAYRYVLLSPMHAGTRKPYGNSWSAPTTFRAAWSVGPAPK